MSSRETGSSVAGVLTWPWSACPLCPGSGAVLAGVGLHTCGQWAITDSLKSSAQGSGAAVAKSWEAEAETETRRRACCMQTAQEADVMPALTTTLRIKLQNVPLSFFIVTESTVNMPGAENLTQDSVISCFYFELFSILFLWI